MSITSTDKHIEIAMGGSTDGQVTKHGIPRGHIAYVTDAEVLGLWYWWLSS